MFRLLAAFSALAAAVALAACGGDDDAPIVPVQTTTTPVAELDQDEFTEETDALCAEAYTALASISTTGEAGTEAAAIAEQSDIYDGLIDDIDALGPPPEDEATLEEYLDALGSVVESLDQQELAAERGETDQVDALAADVDAAEGDALSAADDFGLEDCAEEGEASTGDTGDAATDAGSDTGAAPAPVAPTTPAPTTPAPAPAPAPAPEPAPAPAPAPDGDGGTGGTEPGSGGVSP